MRIWLVPVLMLVACGGEEVPGSGAALDSGPPEVTEPQAVGVNGGIATSGPIAIMLERIGQILLREGNDPVGRVRNVAVHPDGHLFAVADDMNGQVHVFDSAGSRVQVLGRKGQGPGEFDLLRDVVWLQDGRLVAADLRADRLVVYEPDLSSEQTVSLPPLSRPTSLDEMADGRLLVVRGTQAGQARLLVVTPEGEAVRTFFRPSPEPADVPYWSAILWEVAVPFGDGMVAAATNLRFLIYLFDPDGVKVDSIPEPPASWHQAPEPARADFAGARQMVFIDEFLPGITVISRLDTVLDGLLMVTFARFDPQEGAMWNAPDYAMRLYQGVSPVTPEIAVPGRIVAARDSVLTVLEGEPTSWDGDGGWVLAQYRLRVR